ncbi:3851_t:CDS:1, partial [Paraglomus occultum]
FAGIEQAPRHLYLSMYMGFGGKKAWHEFPEPEVPVSANNNIHLVKGPAYESKLQQLCSSHLTPETVETIRRYCQIFFATFGFDAELYPCCIFQENLLPRQHKRQCVSTNKRFVKIWGGSHESQFAMELGPETTCIVNCIHRLLQSFPDPVSFYLNEVEKQFVRNMAKPTYLDALVVNNSSIFNHDITEAVIESDDE